MIKHSGRLLEKAIRSAKLVAKVLTQNNKYKVVRTQNAANTRNRSNGESSYLIRVIISFTASLQ